MLIYASFVCLIFPTNEKKIDFIEFIVIFIITGIIADKINPLQAQTLFLSHTHTYTHACNSTHTQLTYTQFKSSINHYF